MYEKFYRLGGSEWRITLLSGIPLLIINSPSEIFSLSSLSTKRKRKRCISLPRIELETTGMLTTVFHHYTTTSIHQTPEKLIILRDFLNCCIYNSNTSPIPYASRPNCMHLIIGAQFQLGPGLN